jgi:cell division protein FtsB
VRLGLFEVEGIQVKEIKENLIHIQHNFDKILAELLQEVNDIKVRLILELDKKMDKLPQEVDNIRENLHYLKQDSGRKMAELLQEMNNIKANDIREIREKIEKLNAEMKQLEKQTKERIDHIAKLLTEPIFDEDQLKI